MEQHPQPRFRQGYPLPEDVTSKWPWTKEAWLMVLCYAALATMVALLKIYNERAIFDWNGVTLNTIIAILTVALKASLTSVLASCLGQWKWITFSKTKIPVIDFEKIDEASRGSWGFFAVLSRKHIE